jgi:hypothetical protein
VQPLLLVQEESAWQHCACTWYLCLQPAKQQAINGQRVPEGGIATNYAT